MAENEKLLFIRSGVMASAPPHFYKLLVEQYDAVTVSTNSLKQQGMHGVGTIRAASLVMVESTLTEGSNVYNQQYLNQKRRRDGIRQVASRVGGVHVVHLAMYAPLPLIVQRIEGNYLNEAGDLIDPNAVDRLNSDLGCAHAMADRVEWPLPGIEPHALLNGALDARTLLY
jgi:hypothetical protein